MLQPYQDSVNSVTVPNTEPSRWLLLIHQIPPKPEYLRVKIWRRMQRIGAVAVKNSVYVLPKNEEAFEDFQWVLREIVEGGGEGSICEAGFVDGLSDPDLEAMFRAARDADYSAIAEEARELSSALPAQGRKLEASARARLETDATRLRRRLAEVTERDFFDALGRQTAEGLVASLEARLNPDATAESGPGPATYEYRRRVWVTRKGIHVDRMASAWLIRRFIDPEARFKFVTAQCGRTARGTAQGSTHLSQSSRLMNCDSLDTEWFSTRRLYCAGRMVRRISSPGARVC